MTDRFFAPLIQPSTRFEADDQLISYQEWQRLYGKGDIMENWERQITEALADLGKATEYSDQVRSQLAQEPDAPMTVADAITYKNTWDDLRAKCEEADTSLRYQQHRLDNLAHDAAEAGLPTGVWMILSPERAFWILRLRAEGGGSHYSIETRPLASWGDHRAPAEVEADIRDLHDTQADALV